MTAELTVVLVTLAGVLTALWWRQKNPCMLAREYKNRLERHALIQHFDYLAKYANDIILLFDSEYRVVEMSDRALEAYGYTREELRGRHINELRTSAAAAEFDLHRQQLEERKALVYETQDLRKDKTIFPVEVSSRMIVTEGKIFYQNIIRDITERKQVEERLRAASVYARSLLEASLDPLVTISADGYILDVNEATINATGVSRDQLIGSDFSDYFTEPEKAMAGYREVFANGFVMDYPLAIRHVSGKIKDVLYNASVYHDEKGDVAGVFAAARDITERKRAEERLRTASVYARSLIEASRDPLVTISADGHILDVNEATVNATGVPRDQLIGSDFSDYFTEPEKAMAGYREVFATGFVMDYPLSIRHVSGKIMDVLYNASVYHDEKGDVAGVFAAARDITERKRAEEEVRRLNAELEQRVEARTAELRAANTELNSFAYAVSHDLRAPLRAMNGFSQALAEDYGDRLDGDARVYLDQISLASRHMSDLIDGLLVLSRSTRSELNQETLNISIMSERLLAELTAAEPARRVAWTVEAGMQAQGDATMIEVVMRNLIDNAWKYTGKTPDATIRVYTGETEGQRCFCVSDNGAGFDMAHTGKLFQPFQRLHRQEEFSGIGIGLATVQRIVHRHGGGIWANSAPSQGATFCFTLHNPRPLDKETS